MKKSNRNKEKPEKKSFFHSEAATSTIIGAVLLLGIIFSVFAIVRIGYVPEWKSDAECSHMNDVYEDMADLKSKIDMMTVVLASNPNSSYINSSNPSSYALQPIMTVPFHMGGGDVPFIGPIKSSGSLAVNKDNCIMGIVVRSPSGSMLYNKSLNCSTITYNSQNRYYINQNFSYECGALILDQGTQSVMTLYPSIRFSRTPNNKYNVSINALRVFQKPYVPPQVISSNKGCSLRLTGLDYVRYYDSSKVAGEISQLVLTVSTTHPEAWKQYLKGMVDDADIEPWDYSLTENKLNGVHFISLTFPSKLPSESSSKRLERVYLSETVIKAEPGIGLS
ncbi:hypothetical protein [Methanosarcina sp. MSH10X1]|uniref:hypothetical protein n=1 Tax=Methanosarcina sp. MSH10X1 TaxID=2507075 RepID=UPI001F0BF035|nr:hypothetical protein [Methanosarcina sp. MSH10X1]